MKSPYFTVALLCCFAAPMLSRSTKFSQGRGDGIETQTNRPIIGILAQGVEDDIIKKYGKTFIPASYIKYIESAGARVVPIRANSTQEEIESLFSKINGVLFPGGDADLWTSGYAKTGALLFDLALKANDKGDVFPIWGTCLGFQMLHVQAAKGKDILSKCSAENISLPLNFTEGFKGSRMFTSAPESITQDLAKLGVTMNMHVNCVSVETYKKETMLNSFFKVLSTNMDKDNKVRFVSTVEGLKYPFYGSQWHPEKNQFEWTFQENINHSTEAVIVAQYVANFFVNQARLSSHRFANKEEERAVLIYNHDPVKCYPDVTHYEQCYFF